MLDRYLTGMIGARGSCLIGACGCRLIRARGYGSSLIEAREISDLIGAREISDLIGACGLELGRSMLVDWS